jgi:predicted AAA+ superfamily ATPase
VVSRPKVVFHDTGLAARLINMSAVGAGPNANADVAGRLLEGFVAGELHRQRTWSQQDARISHYRDHRGAEVDFILETDDGRIAAIEVKATSTVTARDTRWLTQLRDRLGDRFIAGVVLHTGPTTAPFGPRIVAAPSTSSGPPDHHEAGHGQPQTPSDVTSPTFRACSLPCQSSTWTSANVGRRTGHPASRE